MSAQLAHFLARPRVLATVVLIVIGVTFSTVSCVVEEYHETRRNPILDSGALTDLGVTFHDGGVNTWAQRLASPDRSRRRRAIRELIEGGAEALPLLRELLRVPILELAEGVEEVLTRMGPLALPALARLAQDVDRNLRLSAVTVLRDLGPDAAPAIHVLAATLRDVDVVVAMESARALAAIGEAAAATVPALAKALSHEHPLVRVTAAGALASIGERAAGATEELTKALGDVDEAVRRGAAVALAAVGPAAAPAVDALVKALEDENIYVRICAAGALGGIGEPAGAALEVLRRAMREPGLRNEASWAIEQITGRRPNPGGDDAPVHRPEGASGIFQPREGEWSVFCGSATRNAVSSERGLPASWNLDTGENVLWGVELGHNSYGTPIVSNGVVFIGSDNVLARNPKVTAECGTLLAFRTADGAFLWQDVAPFLGRGLDDFLLPTTTSAPLVEGDRLYYVTAQCQLRCLDTQGFRDGENDGPLRDETFTSDEDADLVWELDIGEALGVYPHEAPNCSVVSYGDLLMVCTSNGVDEAHANVPAPRAPSFIAVDKRRGKVAWQVVGPGENILHGQWSSPSLAFVNGRVLAFFGGGDGWLYGLEAATGREVWRFDGNPKNAVWRTSADIEGVVHRNSLIACPLYHEGRVYLTMGQDPEHGPGRGRLFAIDPGGAGDVTKSRRVWENADIGRSICTPVALDGLLYLGDYNGDVHCVDLRDGTPVWSHDLLAPVWGSILVADGKVYIGDEDGMMTVFATGRERKILGRIDMMATIYSAPVVVDGVLYIPTARMLYAVSARSQTQRP